MEEFELAVASVLVERLLPTGAEVVAKLLHRHHLARAVNDMAADKTVPPRNERHSNAC